MNKLSNPNPTSNAGPVPNPGQLAADLHRDDADEEDESVKQLRECSSIYLSLQDCLVDNNRNWKQCQKEVQALRACNDRRIKRCDLKETE